MAKRGEQTKSNCSFPAFAADSSSATAPSKHSRAARRATSPGIDTDKSLKKARPPSDSGSHRPSVLALRAAAGVSKKKSGRKATLSAKARRRLDKSQDRAEQVMERTALKVARSRGQARNIDDRKRGWGDINSAAARADSKKARTDVEAEAWEDEEMESEDEEREEGDLPAALPPAGTGQGDPDGDAAMAAPTPPLVPGMVPLPHSTDDEEEIL